MTSRGDVLRKLRVPHAMIPLSVVLSKVFDLCMNMVAVFFFMVISGVEPRLTWLELPLLMVFVATFATGLGLIMSALYVRYRDVDQVWTVVRQALFYASPIFYVITKLPDNIERPFAANPLAVTFTQVRQALIDPGAPSAASSLGGDVWLLVPIGIVLGVLAIGIWIFRRESPRIAERL
jgi:ABC-2 type transport system permease protein